jgi:hypothetical protein
MPQQTESPRGAECGVYFCWHRVLICVRMTFLPVQLNTKLHAVDISGSDEQRAEPGDGKENRVSDRHRMLLDTESNIEINM